MSVEINPPFRVFTDVDGEPLEDGYIHIGAVNQNPQVVPIAVFWDSALTIPAFQPIRTLGGYPSRSGTPSRMYVAESSYSISVSNKNSTLIYSDMDNKSGDPGLRQDLAATTGAGLVGFDETLTYAAGTVGKELQDLSDEIPILNVVALDTFAGSSDDEKFTAALAYAKTNKVGIVLPARSIDINITKVYDTSGLGFYQGLQLFGAGQLATTLVNRINSGGIGGPTLRLTSGSASSDQQQGGIVQGIGFAQVGAGTDGHGIEYRGTWHQRFQNIYAQSLTGAALRCVNSAADADSSAHVNINMCRFMECTGGAWNGDGGSGGISVHTIRDLYATNCGATAGASVIIDGCVHFDMRQCSITGQGGGAPAVPLVHIKNTAIRSRLISIEGGEYGNNSGTHLLVDAVTVLTVGGIRHVRRSGETNSTNGIVFANGSSLHQGVVIEQVELQIDTAAPVWTWMTLGTGMAPDFKIVPPNVTSFASGNVMYAVSTSAAAQRISYSVPGNIVRDLSVTDWHQINFTAAGAYTLQAPINGTYGGAEMLITVINSAGATLSFSADYLVTGYVNSVTEKTALFKYDATSALWKQIGAWSA